MYQFFKRFLVIGGVLAAAVAGVVGWLAAFATLPFPRPSGPHAVGFRSMSLVDPARGGRVVTLDVWYPASRSDGFAAVPRIEKPLAQLISKVQGIPDIGGETASFAHLDAPQIAGTLPVIVFNHGYGSFTKQNSSDFEHLASEGWLVVSIGHPRTSLLTRDAGGNPVTFDTDDVAYRRLTQLQRSEGDAFARRVADALAAQRAARTPDAHRSASRALAGTDPYPLYAGILGDWVADTLFVIASLPSLAGADPGRVVLMGHSLGANTALEVARQPVAGVRGVINLDAAWLGDSARGGTLAVPALMLLSTGNKISGQDLSLAGSFDGLLAHQSPGAHVIEVAGSAHFNFTDLSYVPIIRRFSPVLGPVDGAQMMAWQRAAIAEFSRRALTGEDSGAPLLPVDARLVQKYFVKRAG